jgi:hypothetical protein
MTPRLGSLLALALVLLLGAACLGGSDDSATPARSSEDFIVGRPQGRTGIGDVDRAIRRFENTRADLIGLFRAQPWFQDGLDAQESLFAERAITFAGGQQASSFQSLNQASIRDKLFLHERVALRTREIDLLLVYEPGDDGPRQLALLKAILPVLEGELNVEFPEPAITVVNGNYPINDYNPGGFIRLARCCDLSPFVVAHELAHTYWSAGPFWFNEGMADIYATLVLQRLDEQPPEGWRGFPNDIDSFYADRKRAVTSGRFPDLPLPRRFGSDGLYEAADVFLLNIREIIGAQAFAEAASQIYLASDFGRFNVREKRVEDIVLAHTSPEDRDDVMLLFNRQVWGDNGEEYERLKDFEGS